MTAEQKARELINTYYGCNDTNQLGAIEMVERVLLGTICERIDNLYGHINYQKDYDAELINSAINQLKSWQEVAVELGKFKDQIPV